MCKKTINLHFLFFENNFTPTATTTTTTATTTTTVATIFTTVSIFALASTYKSELANSNFVSHFNQAI